MSSTLNKKKIIFLLSQLVAVIALAVTFLLFQIGAFAEPSSTSPSEQSIQESEMPLLITNPTPTPSVKLLDEATPPADGGNSSNVVGNNSVDQACQDFMKSNWDAINAVSAQAWQLWDQQLALEAAASNATDPVEAENLWAQASTVGAEHIRLNNQAIQMQTDFFGGHTGMGCGPNGIYYW